MVDVINLNKKRKAKVRLEKDKKSSENRIRFGTTNNQRMLKKGVDERTKRYLDGHKLET